MSLNRNVTDTLPSQPRRAHQWPLRFVFCSLKPRAGADRPWEPGDFGRNRNLDAAKLLAEFAVTRGVNIVLAPVHLVETIAGSWQPVDSRLCEALRHELDRVVLECRS